MVAKILLVFVVVAENYWLALFRLRYPYGREVLPDSLRHGVVCLLVLHRALLGVIRLIELLLHFFLTFLFIIHLAAILIFILLIFVLNHVVEAWLRLHILFILVVVG